MRDLEFRMMPAHFGPACGPRRAPGGGRFGSHHVAKQTKYAVTFATSAARLEPLLPPGFALDGEPLVTVEATYLTEVAWLAGRGYNIVSVRVPARFEGSRDRVRGPFVAVLWENLCDPILTGREQLGYSKIYADIAAPARSEGGMALEASWMGFRFLRLTVDASTPVPTDAFVRAIREGQGDGSLHYKYLPRTGAPWNQPDAAYATISPVTVPDPIHWPELALFTGTGTVEFSQARWEDMPTQFHIVNALADLEVERVVRATMSRSVGSTDLYEQRILE
jgi:hypothetical protein